MNVDLTKEEIQAVAAMLDAAVRAQGIRVAETAVALMRKLEAATDDLPEKKEPHDDPA